MTTRRRLIEGPLGYGLHLVLISRFKLPYRRRSRLPFKQIWAGYGEIDSRLCQFELSQRGIAKLTWDVQLRIVADLRRGVLRGLRIQKRSRDTLSHSASQACSPRPGSALARLKAKPGENCSTAKNSFKINWSIRSLCHGVAQAGVVAGVTRRRPSFALRTVAPGVPDKMRSHCR